MIAIDTNILVYAHREDNPFHDAAFAKVREIAEGSGAWAIPWPCLHEFLAIVTHPRIYNPPSPLEMAMDQVAAWLESPTVTTLGEGPGHWPTLRGLIGQGKVTGPKIHDARIAALCLQHGIRELWSADRDFSLFPDLRVRNPLIAGTS